MKNENEKRHEVEAMAEAVEKQKAEMRGQIEILLDKYTSFVMEVDSVEREKKAVIDSILTPEIKQALADVDEEFRPILAGLNDNLKQYETAIKSAVIWYGETVKNDLFLAVYSKPRVSWDSKILDKLASYFPEVKLARSEGTPSVSIRRVK